MATFLEGSSGKFVGETCTMTVKVKVSPASQSVLFRIVPTAGDVDAIFVESGGHEIVTTGPSPRILTIKGVTKSAAPKDIQIQVDAATLPGAEDCFWPFTILKCDIDEVKGLYTSNGIYQAGYTSTDNVGRVYCNAQYDTNDITKVVWAKDKQFVDITVRVTPTNAVLPSDARIVWEWEDPDDPSDSGMPTNAAAYIDPNGDTGNDNTGTTDGADVWEQIDSYTLDGAGNNETAISGGFTKVRFNVTDNGGDNFIVKAKFKLNAGATPWDGPQTGACAVNC